MGPRRHPAIDGIGLRQPAGIIPIADADGYHHTAAGNRYPVADADANHCADANFYPDAGANRHYNADAGPIPNPGADDYAHADADSLPHAATRRPLGSHRRRRLCR